MILIYAILSTDEEPKKYSTNLQDLEHKMNLILILEGKLMLTSTQFKNMQERLLELKSIRYTFSLKEYFIWLD